MDRYPDQRGVVEALDMGWDGEEDRCGGRRSAWNESPKGKLM